MVSDFAEAIKQLQQEKGISEELVLKTIENFLLAAYKRKYGHCDNAVVKFNEDRTDVEVYAQKMVSEKVLFPMEEISLEDALTYNSESEIGDDLLIPVDKSNFDRVAVQSAKQKAKQDLRDIQKDSLYSEFKDKVGEMIIGYYQREKNGNIFVDLGRSEGILPKRFQSPREVYRPGDRIKALVHEVNRERGGLQIVLTRTHSEFVQNIFELEVPEIYDGTVKVHKIVREPGYRTKFAVSSLRDDVDPVGACVGLKGIRIQAIVKELEGEKIDIVKYESNAATYIKNALSPARVSNVYIIDRDKKSALAVVEEDQLSLAIGKQGLNVRLANRLVDWNIDVKTPEQVEDMDISFEANDAVNALFGDDNDEIVLISELPGITPKLVEILHNNDIELIETLVAANHAELLKLPGLSEEDTEILEGILRDNVEIVDEEYEEDEEIQEEAFEDEFECPECGEPITLDMEACPKCGVGLSFEVEDEEDGDE
ncbi:transcription termination/antitermination protein NusA [Thiospirochaeta perfilievii]|uniref:Transcription termination/antitermination protein NusA n=1 Tax=Thiospirochaeta perfilievii TaxID=252967 RepID=A0A5C1QGT2_9SPIO|nr:transcription termination factor NusA [Thiospirochaeta perfilievii]QEN06289.1 transcription termination/antitermination protein NusA [Thiospirochaeta perfilievii]